MPGHWSNWRVWQRCNHRSHALPFQCGPTSLLPLSAPSSLSVIAHAHFATKVPGRLASTVPPSSSPPTAGVARALASRNMRGLETPSSSCRPELEGSDLSVAAAKSRLHNLQRRTMEVRSVNACAGSQEVTVSNMSGPSGRQQHDQPMFGVPPSELMSTAGSRVIDGGSAEVQGLPQDRPGLPLSRPYPLVWETPTSWMAHMQVWELPYPVESHCQVQSTGVALSPKVATLCCSLRERPRCHQRFGGSCCRVGSQCPCPGCSPCLLLVPSPQAATARGTSAQ